MKYPEDAIDSYPMGQRIKMWINFANSAGMLDDPDTATLYYIDGRNEKTTVEHAELANPSVGRYEYEIVLPQDGDKAAKPWTFRFEGVSADPTGVNTAREKRFEVEPSPFYPPSS